jgi:hypothetical protein
MEASKWDNIVIIETNTSLLVHEVAESMQNITKNASLNAERVIYIIIIVPTWLPVTL